MIEVIIKKDIKIQIETVDIPEIITIKIIVEHIDQDLGHK